MLIFMVSSVTRCSTIMRPIILTILTILANLVALSSHAQKQLKHFVFFSQDREGIHDAKFYDNPGVGGAQITYPWRKLEPEKNKYDFTEIEEDLEFLASKGKRLFIQVQDVTFSNKYNAVPGYLITDTTYHGGQEPQYGVREDGTHVKSGWYARRFDDSVAYRFHKLLRELAARFDGNIEGINLPETAIDLPEREDLLPTGFSNAKYVASLKKTMEVLRASFTKSVPILYANFMPGGAVELKVLYDHAKMIRHGMGGPDIKVYKWFQMKNSYPLIREAADFVPTGVAVQDGNFNEINPRTNKKVTREDILDFAQHYLKLDYIFWGIEEPYYSSEVLPLLSGLK
jgi:hypothetical protein